MLPVVKYQFQLFPRAIFLCPLLDVMHVGLHSGQAVLLDEVLHQPNAFVVRSYLQA